MDNTLEKLDFIAQQTNQEASLLLGKATKLGIEQLWIQTQLDLYLNGKISREEAEKAVGTRLVRLAERQRDAALEDVKWGSWYAHIAKGY